MAKEINKGMDKGKKDAIYFYELPTDLSQATHMFLNVHFFCKFKGADGKEYHSCTHYYHYNKLLIAGATKEAEECYKFLSGEDIYKFAKRIETAYYDKPEWKVWVAKKDETMKTANRLKYEQNPTLKDQLLLTGDKILIDDHPQDDYWGGRLPNSKNMMGKVLMELRNEFKSSNKIVPLDAPVENTGEDMEAGRSKNVRITEIIKMHRRKKNLQRF